MNLNTINPWKRENRQLARPRVENDPFSLLHRQMDKLFENFFGSQLPAPLGRFGSSAGGFLPQIDLSETDNEVRISAELPGLSDKDVEVTLAANMLTLKGEKKEEHEEEKEDHYHSERSYGYFERSVQLPEGVDADQARAKFKNGVLEIAIPKRPEAQAERRKIELQSD